MASLTELYFTPTQSFQLGEWHIYGSSRVGVYKVQKPLVSIIEDTITAITYQTTIKYRYNGKKQYELSNHLGNVLVTISDRRVAICNNEDSTLRYEAVVVTATDYYSFGSIMPGREYTAQSVAGYRFGFNTQETDDEVYGKGNANSAQFWEYNTRLGRRWNLDPVVKHWESSYSCFFNNSIYFSDPFGQDPPERRLFKNAINSVKNFFNGDSYKNKANKTALYLEKQGYENVDIKYKVDENNRKYADVIGTKQTSESTQGNAGETSFSEKTFKRDEESWLQRNFPEGGLAGGGAGGESRPDFKKVGVPIMFGTAGTIATGGSALVSGATAYTWLGIGLGVNSMGTNSKGETILQSFGNTKEQKKAIKAVETIASIACIKDAASTVRKMLSDPNIYSRMDLKAGIILNSSSGAITSIDLLK